MEHHDVLTRTNRYGLQGEILRFKSSEEKKEEVVVIKKTEISVNVLTANKLRISYVTLDFMHPKSKDCHIAVWQDCLTPPYGSMDEKNVYFKQVENNGTTSSVEITCDHADVNFYDDDYCVGFCMGNKQTSVCSFASLIGGAMVTNFESAIFSLGVSTRQVTAHYTTPPNNDPSDNSQFIDLYKADAEVKYENCLSVRGLMGNYNDGQITLNVKEGTVLSRGERYKILYDFNGDYSSYGCQYFFDVPE
jgi:hypothetical protein